MLSIAELCGGVREGEEHSRLDAFVATSVRPQPWQQAGATLATLNRGHFPMLADVLGLRQILMVLRQQPGS